MVDLRVLFLFDYQQHTIIEHFDKIRLYQLCIFLSFVYLFSYEYYISFLCSITKLSNRLNHEKKIISLTQLQKSNISQCSIAIFFQQAEIF